MPPIRSEMEIRNQTVKLPDIPPGSSGSFTDMDTPDPSILIVSCNPDDNGGIIYRQAQSDTTEVLNHAFRVVSGESGQIEAVIGENESLTIPVITKFGNAVLKLQHF